MIIRTVQIVHIMGYPVFEGCQYIRFMSGCQYIKFMLVHGFTNIDFQFWSMYNSFCVLRDLSNKVKYV